MGGGPSSATTWGAAWGGWLTSARSLTWGAAAAAAGGVAVGWEGDRMAATGPLSAPGTPRRFASARMSAVGAVIVSSVGSFDLGSKV